MGLLDFCHHGFLIMQYFKFSIRGSFGRWLQFLTKSACLELRNTLVTRGKFSSVLWQGHSSNSYKIICLCKQIRSSQHIFSCHSPQNFNQPKCLCQLFGNQNLEVCKVSYGSYSLQRPKRYLEKRPIFMSYASCSHL